MSAIGGYIEKCWRCCAFKDVGRAGKPRAGTPSQPVMVAKYDVCSTYCPKRAYLFCFHLSEKHLGSGMLGIAFLELRFVSDGT